MSWLQKQKQKQKQKLIFDNELLNTAAEIENAIEIWFDWLL
jgi:hypothetical protein